jgi:probable H4MPT-linked C1 transfer pathway protein
MSWLGLDIGGANLKVADGYRFALLRPFALWREPKRLSEELGIVLEQAPSAERLAVTMSGELADCFSSKPQGVAAIVEAVVRAAEGRQVAIYGIDGDFVTVEQACRQPAQVASANWHALATLAARCAEGAGLLIDVGTTTTDIIRLVGGQPDHVGFTDTQRLLAGELVYSGVWRTPLAALVDTLPWRAAECPVARELFATTLDVYLTLGEIPEDGENNNTADGRPATRPAARARLARMICADGSDVTDADAEGFAAAVAARQRADLRDAAWRVVRCGQGSPQRIVVSGQGAFLARQIAQQAFPEAALVSLNDRLGAAVSVCAAAHAVAVLARERAC